MADLLSLGEHCSLPDCRQRDFLPFKCDCCGKVYCLEHRTYDSHACDKAHGKDGTTIVCPLCARLVKIKRGEDINLRFEQHTQQDCDPDHYAQVHRKKKCPVLHCKEKLTTVNTYTCKHCRQDVCLKHRLASDHQCAPQPGRRPNAGGSALSRLLNFNTTQPAAQPSKPAQRITTRQPSAQVQSAQPPAHSSNFLSDMWNRFTDSSGTSQQREARSHVPPAPKANQNSSNRLQNDGSDTEACPTCGARFRSVDDLIAHCQLHNLGPGSEICPQCQAVFHSVIDLVRHVERQHSSKSARVSS